jgi:hypothetical protein
MNEENYVERLKSMGGRLFSAAWGGEWISPNDPMLVEYHNLKKEFKRKFPNAEYFQRAKISELGDKINESDLVHQIGCPFGLYSGLAKEIVDSKPKDVSVLKAMIDERRDCYITGYSQEEKEKNLEKLFKICGSYYIAREK